MRRRTVESDRTAKARAKEGHLLALRELALPEGVLVLADQIPRLCVALGASALQMPPVVICPGFGNADRDYVTPLDQPAEKGLVACLARRGFDDVTVLDLPRWEWARVAAGSWSEGS